MNDPQGQTEALFGTLRNVGRSRGLRRDRDAGPRRRGPAPGPHQRAGVRRQARPRRGKGHQRLPACLAARPVRAELERAVPGLRRRARFEPAAQVGAQGGLRLRAVLEGLRADARRDGRGRLHGEPAGAADRGARSAFAAGVGILPPDFLGLRHRPAGRRAWKQILEEITIDSIELGPGEKGADLGAAAGRIRHRVRAGDACRAFHRRQGRADQGAADAVADLQQGASRRRSPPRCGRVRCGSRSRTRATCARCRRCGSPATRCTTCSASGGRS